MCGGLAGGANQTEKHNVKISIQGRVTTIPRTNIPGLHIAIFPYLPPIMLVCIVCQDIFLNHIRASTHRAIVAAWSSEMMAGSVPRQLRKIMESGWKSDVKKARGLDGEIEKVFGERERLRG